MRSAFLCLVLASLPFTALAATARAHSYSLKEEVPVPRGWTRGPRAPTTHHIDLRIGLPQGDFAALEGHLWEISDPQHERYGQHLSQAEVEALVAPGPDALAAVDEWLQSHGIDLEKDVSRSPAQDWVKLTVPVSLAEELLDTEYHVFQHASGESIVRTTAYRLPAHVHAHVDVVQPTTTFGLFRPMTATSHFADESSALVSAASSVLASTGATVNASCNSMITPQCLYDLYSVNHNGTTGNGNSIGTTGYLEKYFNSTDLNNFYRAFVPEAVGQNVTVFSVNGGINNQSAPSGEAELDTQYAFGIGYPAKATFYTTAGRPPVDYGNNTASNSNEPYQDWLDFVLKQGKDELPLVISTSYGDIEETVPYSYAKRVCAGMAQLGARGVTVLFSSGDLGVGDGEPSLNATQCYALDGSGRRMFLPTFPATCPYVTSVGATKNMTPEIGVGFSGGGFSNYFARPLYQTPATPGFLAQLPHGTYAGLYNATGRGVPDMSAQGVRFAVAIEGRATLISGTSASTPTTAGLFARLNDARLAAGLPSIGFANPLLYAGLGFGFNDITRGNNPGCGTPGWNATKGWDPITGLGTPNFAQLKELVLGFGLF